MLGNIIIVLLALSMMVHGIHVSNPVTPTSMYIIIIVDEHSGVYRHFRIIHVGGFFS